MAHTPSATPCPLPLNSVQPHEPKAPVHDFGMILISFLVPPRRENGVVGQSNNMYLVLLPFHFCPKTQAVCRGHKTRMPGPYKHLNYIKLGLSTFLGQWKVGGAGHEGVVDESLFVLIVDSIVFRITQIKVERAKLILELIRLACVGGHSLSFLDDERYYNAVQTAVFRTSDDEEAPPVTAAEFPFLREAQRNYASVRAIGVDWLNGAGLSGIREHFNKQYLVRCLRVWSMFL